MMRKSFWMAWFAVGTGAGFATVVSGCFINTDLSCEHTQVGCPTSGELEGGRVEASVDCRPSAAAEVAEVCGVFVSSAGTEGGAGTKAAPVKTLAEAVKHAQEGGTGRVYACAEAFEGAVEVPAGVTVFGGLDCQKGWRWAEGTRKTRVTAPMGEVPLRLRGGEGEARLEDVEVEAKGIMVGGDAALKGASSIAVVAEGIRVSLVRSTLVAGDGAAGEEGAGHGARAGAGADGTAGRPACAADGGEPQVENLCGTADDVTDDSIGGLGGSGRVYSGGGGESGLPGLENAGTGADVEAQCEGKAGGDGESGEGGDGARGLGSLSAAGYVGAKGADGGKGEPGQGGGGGGGRSGGKGVGQCPQASTGSGASGGNGASGGCGGAGGRGGGAGGASIALVSLEAQVVFDDVVLRTGRGGVGGSGGPGQNGGLGGAEGGKGGAVDPAYTQLKEGCPGGAGGNGGKGGQGGGGLGGHAIGVAFRGVAPSLEGAVVTLGEPGAGGTSADAEHAGAPGTRADLAAFP
ncbi:uncharacterized protein CMC5_013840 [Chondromyces crocatus]|uniref:PGRS family protein n=2 Tax=Chondromyces crocatus TaxID=52 RepID=A0A0K1E9K1_CHOCO|nr:uncharacterized protein CMC5_013840 [Chondromyces crocatus]